MKISETSLKKLVGIDSSIDFNGSILSSGNVFPSNFVPLSLNERVGQSPYTALKTRSSDEYFVGKEETSSLPSKAQPKKEV